jgi:hypothetical protein
MQVHLLNEKPEAERIEYLNNYFLETGTRGSLKCVNVKHHHGSASVRRRLADGTIDLGNMDVILVVVDETVEKDVLLSDSQVRHI